MRKAKDVHRRKIFKERISLFDHLCQVNPYFDGLYTACKIQFSLFIVYVLVRDSFRARGLYFDASKDQIVFGGVKDWVILFGVECVQFSGFVLLYLLFLAWTKARQWLGRLAFLLYFTTCVAYFCGSFCLVWNLVYQTHLAAVPTLVAFIELVRYCLKTYSFVRENAYKVLYPWHKDDDFGPAVWYAGQMSPQVGSFSQYLYFLFAPTLLYRDHYPRNKGPINWSRAMLYGVQFAGAYFVARFVFLEVQFPSSMRLDDLVETYLKCLLCAPFMSFLACILVFNAWFNFTAELTKFGDREFYQNWWSALGYSEYYRMWNIPVYDFLYTYIYQDLHSVMSSRSLASLPALVLSSFLHDFFMGVSTGFFFPAFIIMFALIGGTVLVSGVKFSKPMTFFLTGVGIFLLESFYYTEVTARYYCPKDNITSFEYRTFHCYQEYNNHTLFTWLL